MEKDYSEISDSSLEEIFYTAYRACENLGWEIDLIHELGFEAVTNNSMSASGELVTIEVSENSLKIESELLQYQLFDYGKNKKNIRQFYEEFDSLFEKSNVAASAEFYREIKFKIAEHEQKLTEEYEKEFGGKTGMIKSFKEFFKPREGYYATPIIVALNLFVFIILSIMGVNPFAPTAEQLFNFGGNFSAYSMNGEYWRLFTSCFIHGGLFHLLFNMYALLYIGAMLEGLLGSSKFAYAYVVSGIAASAVSSVFNPNVVSVGASGAIFGMYGVFLALLTTKIINRRTRNAIMPSISIFVFYNLFIGFSSKADSQGMAVDNAAHIGGLLAGIVIGYAMYYVLRKNENRTSFAVLAVILVVLVSSIASAFDSKSEVSGDFLKYETLMNKYYEQEVIVENALSQTFSVSNSEIQAIKNEVLPAWEEALKIAKEMQILSLSYDLISIVDLIDEYTQAQINYFTYLVERDETGEFSHFDNKLDSLESVISNIQYQLMN
jgi:rhomboid protease GluP